MPIVEAQDLQYAYPDGHPALGGLTFAVEPGERVGLAGPNGAGKSTLLQLLAGVLLPGGGALTVAGHRAQKGALPAIRRAAGLVFQDSDDQLFCSTVREDVAFGPRNLKLPEAEVAERVERALALTGATPLADRPPYKLSGGEKRAAAVAAVLAMEPQVLLLDEPSSSMDPQARRRLIHLMRGLPQAQIVASHDLDLLWEVCDRVLVLRQGAIAADGPAHDVLRDETLLASCALELPLRLQPLGKR